jgi:hypothetical protein
VALVESVPEGPERQLNSLNNLTTISSTIGYATVVTSGPINSPES